MHRLSLALSVAGALALTVTACGGSGSSDKDQITTLIKDVGNDPALLCTKYATDTLVAKAGGKTVCIEASRFAKDPNVKVNSVTVNGDTATAKITGNGGPATITLTKVNGDWKQSGGHGGK